MFYIENDMKFFNIFKSSLIAIKLIDDAIYYYMKNLILIKIIKVNDKKSSKRTIKIRWNKKKNIFLQSKDQK